MIEQEKERDERVHEAKKLIGQVVREQRKRLGASTYKVRTLTGSNGHKGGSYLLQGIEYANKQYTIDKLLAVLDALGGTLSITFDDEQVKL